MYDLTWASRVLRQFEKKHAGACATVSRAWLLSRNDVLRLIMSDQPGWRFYKRFVKLATKQLIFEESLRAAWGRFNKTT